MAPIKKPLCFRVSAEAITGSENGGQTRHGMIVFLSVSGCFRWNLQAIYVGALPLLKIDLGI